MLVVTYILFAAFLGVMIGGFAFGNNTVGIIGVTLAVVDAIVGIAITYFRNKANITKSTVQLQNNVRKIQHLTAEPYATESFTIAELATGVVNLLDGLHTLSSNEYFYLKKIYDAYQHDLSRITVTYQGLMSYSDKIISNYDMVVPYYKVCGKSGFSIAELLEENKLPYRVKAKILIDNGKLFSNEWKELNLKFYEEFYNEV